MSAICQNCGKTVAAGRSQKHRRGVAGKRWKNRVTATLRLFRPNLQTALVTVGGEKQRMTLCTKCLKRFRMEERARALA